MPRTRRARRLIAALTAAAVTWTLAACSPEAPLELNVPAQVEGTLPDATREQLQAAVEHAMAVTGSPGAIVGVWAPWSGSWVAGLGTTRPGGPAVRATTSFKAASVTRAMTCDVLYGMVDDGIVSLDESVTEYVAGLPAYDAVTLGQLCDSTSGIGSYAGKLVGRWLVNPQRVWNPRELVAYGMAGGLAFEPGTAFRDSDTGYVLLGLALERAAGKSASQLFDEYIFTPLGLTDTSLPSKATPTSNLLPGLQSGDVDGAIDCAAPADVTSLSPTAVSTASGVVSTVADLGRYVQALAVGARDYDTDERFAEPYPVDGGASWFTARGGAYQAGTLIGQSGPVPGYLTAAYADRNTGMTVVVVLNNSRASNAVVRLLAWQLAAIASKAPAASGETAPEAGLPWTAESVAAELDTLGICPAP